MTELSSEILTILADVVMIIVSSTALIWIFKQRLNYWRANRPAYRAKQCRERAKDRWEMLAKLDRLEIDYRPPINSDMNC